MSIVATVLFVASLTAGCQARSTADTIKIADAAFHPQPTRIEAGAMAAGDFDNDGHLDLVGTGQSELIVYLGSGGGELSEFGRVHGGENPVDLTTSDLDADGDLDLAVANHETHYITLVLGDGNGSFRPAPDSPLYIDVQPHPHAVKAIDLDADGFVELIVDHRYAEAMLVLRGLGGGKFSSPGRLVDVGGDPYRGMALGDLNGDGRIDMVTPNPKEVAVMLNVNMADIKFARANPVDASDPFSVGLGDFNADGHLDLFSVSGERSAAVELFLGNGRGDFTEAVDSPFRFAVGPKNIAVGDFNGDGVDDAAVSCYQSSEVMVLLGGRDSIRTGHLPGGEHPWYLAVADLNEDGRDDLVISDDAVGRATVYLSVRF